MQNKNTSREIGNKTPKNTVCCLMKKKTNNRFHNITL